MYDTVTILVASADCHWRHQIAEQLKADGHRVLEALSDSSTRKLLAHDPHVLLLSELDAPAQSTQLLRALRADELDAPAVLPVLTFGATDLVVELRAYELGSDHHLPGACDYVLLRAVLAAVLRRCATPARRSAVLRIGPLSLDPAARRVELDGELIELPAREYELLRVLASDPTRVWRKDELLMQVWGHGDYSRTRTLDSHACRLRKALRRDAGRTFVQNIWGVGYRLTDS